MTVAMPQYKDLYVRTAKEYVDTLSTELLTLEKEPDQPDAIEAVFRAAHSLKGQSAAMGYTQIGYLCHVIEDVFHEVKEHHMTIDSALADLLFQSLDQLKNSIAHIDIDDVELSCQDIADNLKAATGLQTEGTGKSLRPDQKPSPAVIETPLTKPKAAENDTDIPLPAVPHLQIKTIPVKVDQLDDIVGSLEELMVHRLVMQTLAKQSENPEIIRTQDKIDELIDLIQFQVMKIRTVPISLILTHYPRAVRDIAKMLDKQLELKIEGGDLELDRTIVERLDEPLTHLIRNAADHGIDKSGVISITARAERDFAIVSVSDDGAGINWEAVAQKAHVNPDDRVAVKKALFSGISTTTEVSLLSGRGVGLETVKKTIEDMGGSIDVSSTTGKGAMFTMKLPLTISVVRTLIVRVDFQRYAIAATAVDRSIKVNTQEIVTNLGQETFRYQEQDIPLIRLRNAFNQSAEDARRSATYAVIVNVDGDRVALAVDEVNDTLETVVRPLPDLLKGSRLFSGVTIAGDSSSVLLINPRGFTNA